MDDWASIGSLLGGIGLFLLGMSLMTNGLKLAAGHTLEHILSSSTSTRLRGLATGALITSLVQSSSAVTVATIGFVNAGLLTLNQSLWVLFGSNVGTTVAELNRVIADFITRLNRSGMSPEGAQRLPAILRIARYYETLAELAREVAATQQAAPAPAESGKFAAQAEALLDAVDPANPRQDTDADKLALEEMETHYQTLKSALLAAGAQGTLAVNEMDARLRSAGAIRRAVQQAVKAAIMLDGALPDKLEQTPP